MRRRRSIVAAVAIAAFVVPLAGFALLVRQRQEARPLRLDPATHRLFWDRGMSYQEFIDSDTSRHAQWLANGARADGTVDAVIERARAIPGRWKLLVVAECSCSDAVNSVPYLARLAARDSAIELRVLRKEDAGTLLRAHLLEGRAATPLVLVLDDSFIERGVWIELPRELRSLIAEQEPQVSRDSLRALVREWYAKDAGAGVLGEVLDLMAGAVGRRTVAAAVPSRGAAQRTRATARSPRSARAPTAASSQR